MTERPYTDDDLRAAAMDQHAAALRDPDFMGIGEQLEGRYVRYEVVDPDHGGLMPAPGAPRWDELSEEDFDAAQRAIDHLLSQAADVSEWAIDLGADGLEPTGHVLKVGSADKQIARIHFAFDPDLAEDVRTSLVEGLAQVIADSL